MKAQISPIPASTSEHRRHAELEAWICERLALRDLFAGITDTATRRDRLECVLLERGLVDSIAGSRERKPVTWRALVKTLYNHEMP